MIRILMIDDHPSQLEGYKIILSYNLSGTPIDVKTAFDCESAYKILLKSAAADFDLVFLDRSLPPYAVQNIRSGEDLIPIIRKQLPKAKIAMLTSHAEAFMLYNIVQKYAPEGLLVKSDFSAEELLDAFEKLLVGETYHTQTVKDSIKELLSRNHYLDSYNRQIITLLSQGIKTKNIHEHLNLSQSAVEKRKAQIKEYLCLEKGSDEDIVREAKKLGFI